MMYHTSFVAIDKACRGKFLEGSRSDKLGRYGSELLWSSFVDSAVRRLSSWAALECRAEGSDCAPIRGLVSESAVHTVTVMSPSGNRAVRMSKRPTLGPGPGRAVHGQRAESHESMLVPSNCQGATGRYTGEVLALGPGPEGRSVSKVRNPGSSYPECGSPDEKVGTGPESQGGGLRSASTDALTVMSVERQQGEGA